MKRLAAIMLCLISQSHAVCPVPLSELDAIKRTVATYTITVSPVVPGSISMAYFDSLPCAPFWTASADAMKGPFTIRIASGGVATVYVRFTIVAADGSIPPRVVLYKFHYPDAPVTVGPSAPTGISVT